MMIDCEPSCRGVECEVLQVVHSKFLELLAHFAGFPLTIRKDRVNVVIRDGGCS